MFGSNNNSLFGTSNTSSGQNNTRLQSTQNTVHFDGMSRQQPQQSFGSTSFQPFFGTNQFSIVGWPPNTTTTLGGQSTSSTFGGTTSSIIGGNQRNDLLFGANVGVHTNTNSSLFGRVTPICVPNGTNIKFKITAGTDTLIHSGQSLITENINTRHQSITFMKEYESKSFEELRLEDYTDNRKGSQQRTPLFGNTTAVSSRSSFRTTFTQQNAFSPKNTALIGQNKQQIKRSSIGTTSTEKECNLCLDEPINCALYKCGHVCMCYNCALKQRQSSGRCPLCRAIINDVLRIYLP